jgi:hypothetical protein
MRLRVWLGWLIGSVLALTFALMGAGIAASELGGEVVKLHTGHDAGVTATRLWVVDDAGYAWLRASSSRSRWLTNINAEPGVVFDRAGQVVRARATPVPDPRVCDRINRLMREKYGFADRVVGFLVVLTGRDRARAVPVRLEPMPPSG